MTEILSQKQYEQLKYITIKKDCEIIGFIELLSIGKFFRKNLSDYYGDSLTEVLKGDLDKVLEFIDSLDDKYKEIKKQAVIENSYEPFQTLFAGKEDILTSSSNLWSWYYDKVYSPNIAKLSGFAEILKKNLVEANMETEIEDMLNFFNYHPAESKTCTLFLHMFLTNHAKGESINDLGILFGFKANQEEFTTSISDIDKKESWSEERKNAIKNVIQYFPAPIILHEMTHYYYNKSGKLEEIKGKYALSFQTLNQEIEKLNERHRLPGTKEHQAFSLLNEALATSFQGILQERLGYQDNKEGKLYDSNDLIDQTAKAIMPIVKEYIEDKKQIDNEFILSFLKKAREVCTRLPHEIDIVHRRD